MITPLRVGAVLAALTMTVLITPTAAAVTDLDLASRWAPIHYQDTDSSDYDADYVTAVDYDGDWDTLNNWEHQDDRLSRLTGTAYYSVVETETHWFIGYSFYHPRDWEDFPDPWRLFTHENDMEGMLLTVRRDGTAYGKLEAMVTVAHSDFYSYVPADSTFTSGRENVDGRLILRDGRPTTRQEAKGHGLYAWNGAEFPGGDGVVYQPTGTAEVPSSGNDRSVGYRLVSVFAEDGMWARRDDSATFAGYGTFRGDNGRANSANAPWGWNDRNDGDDITRGMLASDPAHLVGEYFAGEGTFSRAYTRNDFR